LKAFITKLLILAIASFFLPEALRATSFTDLSKALKANRNEVTELTISGFDAIPGSVFTFKRLQKLTVRNGLKNIPENINELGVLSELIFVDDDLKGIPENIKYCKYLKDLRFINCHLVDLPKEVFELPALEKLNLKNNQITRLPLDFNDNYSLKELNIKYNKIKILDDCIQRFYALETFYFSGNPIAIIKGNWDDERAFKKLKTVVMKDCNLENMPVFLCKNINYLDISNNKIREISDEEVIQLQNLGFLSLENNPIHLINESLFKLRKLKSLQLDKYESIIIQLSEQSNICLSFSIQDIDRNKSSFKPCGKKKGMIAIYLSEPTKKRKSQSQNR